MPAQRLIHQVLPHCPGHCREGHRAEHCAHNDESFGVRAGIVKRVVKKVHTQKGKRDEQSKAQILVFLHLPDLAFLDA